MNFINTKMPIPAELRDYLEIVELSMVSIQEQLDVSEELNQGLAVKGSVKDSYTDAQEKLLEQLRGLLEQYRKEAESNGFIKQPKKFSTLVNDILIKLDATRPNSDQILKLEEIKSICSEVLRASTNIAAKEIDSCFVVDMWAGGTNAALTALIPLVKENLSNLQGATLESLRASGGYSREDATVAQNFIAEINKVPIDEHTLVAAHAIFKTHPLAIALLNDVINHGGGPGKRPAHKLILHCDLGISAELGVAYPATLMASDVVISTHEQLKKLRDNFKAHMEDIASNELKVLYIGLGHGGDIEGEHNLRRQMGGILGSDWEPILKKLADQETHAKYIIAESCYSAAFAKDFRELLTPDGVMQLEALECTPAGGLEASVRYVSNPGESFYTTSEIEQTEHMARQFLAKLGKNTTDEALVARTADGLLSILAHKEGNNFTEAELRSNPILNTLIEESNASEYTMDEVIAVSGYLPPTFDLWSYYDRDTMKPIGVASVLNLKSDVKLALLAGGVPEDEATKLSALYVETTRAYMSFLFGKNPADVAALIGTPYPKRLSEEMLQQGSGFGSYEKLHPPVTIVESKGDSLNRALEALNEARATPTSKIILTKNEIHLPFLMKKPENAAEQDWKIRLEITGRLVKRAYCLVGEAKIYPLADGQRGALTLLNTCAGEARREFEADEDPAIGLVEA